MELNQGLENENKNIFESNEKNDLEDKDEVHLKRKRRSKNDPDGRGHRCDLCGKSYLSRPALSQHLNSKHQDRVGEFKRGRGRPRKNGSTNPGNSQNSKESKFKNFLLTQHRAKIPGEESISVMEVMRNCLLKLYEDYREFLWPEVKSILEEHLLLKVGEKNETEKEKEKENNEVNNKENNNNNHGSDKKLTYDEIIHKYLEAVAEKTNKNYFTFACSFSILFRESYNHLKRKDNPDLIGKDYSSFNGAEELPDTCNDFITEFMDKNNYFNLDQNEVIEIIQHFCSWLFENGHTFQMLTLC